MVASRVGPHEALDPGHVVRHARVHARGVEHAAVLAEWRHAQYRVQALVLAALQGATAVTLDTHTHTHKLLASLDKIHTKARSQLEIWGGGVTNI